MNKFVVLIFSLSAYYSPSTGQPNDGPPSPIVFMDPQKEQQSFPFSHLIQSRADPLDLNKGKSCFSSFCEDIDGYPNDFLATILKNTNEFDKLFNTVVPEIGDRLPDEEENLCSSTTNISYPRVGKNVEDKTRIIVNLNSYKQGIVIETCRENSECQFNENLPLGIKTTCKQRYTQLRLLALDDNDKPAMDVFPAPSCCVCMYKRT